MKALNRRSSMTALTSLSNRIGSTTTLRGTTLKSAEPIGTACGGISLMSSRRLSSAHWPTKPSPILKPRAGVRWRRHRHRRTAAGDAVGVPFHLIDHAKLGIDQRGQFAKQQSTDGASDRAVPAACR